MSGFRLIILQIKNKLPRWICCRPFIISSTLLFCFFTLFYFQQSRPSNTRDVHNEVAEILVKKLTAGKDDSYVIYNRVPKCASMSMTTLCYRLGGANGFKVASPYEEGEIPSKTEEEQRTFVDFLLEQKPGYIYIRHQYFIDFTRFGLQQPIYINMIRDPVARFESFYYFSRFGNERGGGGASSRMTELRRQESIDQCIQRQRQECTKPYWQVVPYFCGQEPGCMSRSKWAVERAKQNIERHYTFVGLLEELDTSLNVLELMSPKYFKEARKIYHNPENERMKHETHTRNKQITSESAKNFLKTQTSLHLEYELYYFVQERLNKLRKTLL